MSDKITEGQKSFLLSLGYDAPRPIDHLTKQEAAVCINQRLATKRSNSPNWRQRRSVGLMRSGLPA